MKKIILSFCCLILFACSGESVSFDRDDAETVTVEAYMMRIGDSAKTRLKADTLLPTDSVVFISAIEPSRSIRILEFYWQIDSGKTHSEFSHRTQITEPGKHVIRFTLLDRFADTLQDSVTLWIAPEPVLDTKALIPRDGTSGIDPNSPISFAWKASVQNLLAETQFSFSLKCGSLLLIDTILSSPQFTFDKKLPPLRNCSWSVFAKDDFGNTSQQTIRASFLTRSEKSESATGAVFAKIQIPFPEIFDSLKITLLNSDGENVKAPSVFVDMDSLNLFVGNLPNADYKLFITNTEFPDYTSDTIPFSIQAGNILDLGAVFVLDTVPPKISCTLCRTDSIPWQDTLLFFLEEGGKPIHKSNIHAVFDGREWCDLELSSDTIRLFLNSSQKSFLWHPLTISVVDRAGNRFDESIFVSPGKSCVETLSEAQIRVDSSIQIPIKNICPNLTPKRFFWDIDDDGHWEGEAISLGEDSVQRTFSGTLFRRYSNWIRVRILYESGAEYEAAFFLFVLGVSG